MDRDRDFLNCGIVVGDRDHFPIVVVLRDRDRGDLFGEACYKPRTPKRGHSNRRGSFPGEKKLPLQGNVVPSSLISKKGVIFG